MKNYNIHEFAKFIEEINKQYNGKGIELECYLDNSCGSSKYLWRINVEKKGYTYHTTLYDKRFNGIYGIMMTAKSTYTDVDIDVVKKAIKDALSFIKEDEQYTQSVLQYTERIAI